MAEFTPATWDEILPSALPQEQKDAVIEAQNRGSKIAGELRVARPAFTPGNWDDIFPGAAAKVEAAPVKQPSVFSAAGAGFAHGTLGLAEAVNLGLQFIGNRVGSPAMAERGEAGAQYWGEKAKAFEAPADIQGSIADDPALLLKSLWWAYNLADTLPSLVASIIPGVGAARAISVAGKAVPLTEKVIERLAIAGGALTGRAA